MPSSVTPAGTPTARVKLPKRRSKRRKPPSACGAVRSRSAVIVSVSSWSSTAILSSWTPGRSKAYTSSSSCSQTSTAGTHSCAARPLPSKRPFITRLISVCSVASSRIGSPRTSVATVVPPSRSNDLITWPEYYLSLVLSSTRSLASRRAAPARQRANPVTAGGHVGADPRERARLDAVPAPEPAGLRGRAGLPPVRGRELVPHDRAGLAADRAHLDVPARQLGASAREHALPLDLRQQRRGCTRPGAVPPLLP